MLPIWAIGIIFSVVYTQMSTLFVEQGTMMDTYIGYLWYLRAHVSQPPLHFVNNYAGITWVVIFACAASGNGRALLRAFTWSASLN